MSRVALRTQGLGGMKCPLSYAFCCKVAGLEILQQDDLEFDGNPFRAMREMML